MRKKYFFPELTREQRLFYEDFLLDNIDRQQWSVIIYLTIWGSEGLICIQ